MYLEIILLALHSTKVTDESYFIYLKSTGNRSCAAFPLHWSEYKECRCDFFPV